MKGKRFYWLLAALAAAAALRLFGIRWGLPFTINADEPHIVNLALSFGAGTLRPYAFKYPTLWPYALFICYGLYFLAWSGFGLRRSVSDFAGFYAWHPGGFYLIGRLLSSALSISSLFFIWRAEEDSGRAGRTPWAALLLAFSPVIIEAAHSCKPDMLMFFFACAAWLFALRVYRRGQRRDYLLCGAALGLAASSQFTALPAWMLLPLASLLRGRIEWRRMAEGLACATAAFLAASPFIAVDFRNFLFWSRMVGPAVAAGGAWGLGFALVRAWLYLLALAGPWAIAGIMAVAGFAVEWRRDKRLSFLLLLPGVVYVLLLSSPVALAAAHPRYLLPIVPGCALLAAEGLGYLEGMNIPWTRLILIGLAVGPSAFAAARADHWMRLPDTRRLAAAWIEKNVPQGSTIILDAPHASPNIAMIRGEIEELLRKAEASGSPRARIFRAMAGSHSGGGYRIYRILRSSRDLGASPMHVELSQADAPMADLRAGLGAARALGAGWIVTTTFGASRQGAPELSALFDQLDRQARLEAVFEPEGGAFPAIKIYKIPPG